MTLSDTYTREFKAKLADLKGTALAGARVRGIEAFVAQGGIPTAKAEDWRYANLSSLRSAHLPSAVVNLKSKTPRIKGITGWPLVVVHNGAVLEIPAGLKAAEILSTDAALTNMPEWGGEYASGGLDKNPLERLNLAFAEAGVFINVKAGATLEGIEIIFLEDGREETARHLRNFIRLEAGATANILVRSVGLKGNAGWTNAVTNIIAGKGAHLNLTADFEQTGEALQTCRVFAHLEESAALNYVALCVGIPALRNEIGVNLAGRAAAASLHAGLLAAKSEVIDFVTRFYHTRAGAKSTQIVKAAAGRAGKTSFQGRVVVEKDAQKTEAHQNCHNLILERTGETNVKPELLIFADDVICTHGATVGEIDENALFYMMQRGIPEALAKAMLVRVFFAEVVEGVKTKTIREHFEGKINAWMQQNLAGDQT